MQRNIGYARTSTPEQNPALQHQALAQAGCHSIYTDLGKTGRTIHRPQLEEALQALRPGDTLTVWKLDRLGRNLQSLAQLLEDLEERGVSFCSLTEGIDTSTPVGKLLFHILASVAEMESNLISERTKAGIAALRAHNVRNGKSSGAGPGRPKKLTPAQEHQIRLMRSQINPVTGSVWSIRQLAALYGVGASTVVRTLDSHSVGRF